MEVLTVRSPIDRVLDIHSL